MRVVSDGTGYTKGRRMLDWFEELAGGLNHPEGVAWNPFDGHVYAGGEGGEIYRVSLAGEVEPLASTGGSLLGLAVDGVGRIYACDSGKGEVARLDPANGALETFARGPGGREMDTPNVAAFGPDGVLYVTCSGEAGTPEILRIGSDGIVDTWSQDVAAYPNGCVVSPDGSSLLVVEAKSERIVRVPIRTDGSAGEPETFATLPDTDADGLALDAEQHVWVTLYRPDGILRVDPDGRVVLKIDDHLATTFDAPTNMVFVGPKLDRAVVANVGSRHLSVADVGVSGQDLHYPEVA